MYILRDWSRAESGLLIQQVKNKKKEMQKVNRNLRFSINWTDWHLSDTVSLWSEGEYVYD